MSTGELCGARIKIGTQINGTNTIEVCCDQYAGHEGDHEKQFYHTYKNEEDVLLNQRLGNIKWGDGLAKKSIDQCVCTTICLGIDHKDRKCKHLPK